MNMLKATNRLILLISALWLAGTAQTALAKGEQVVVKVKPEIVALQPRVSLGDLASFEAPTPELTTKLRGVGLGYAPAVGLVREIPRQRIELAINAAGFAEGTYRLESPAAVVVRRAAQHVDPALVREAIERAALTDLNASGATARLARCDFNPVIEAPAGEIDIRASIGTVKDVFSDFTAFVEIRQEGSIVVRTNATVRVEAYAPVLVAQRDIASNTRLRSESLKVEVRKIESPLSQFLTDPGRLKGMSVKRAIARGEIIPLDALIADIVIRPGDIVRINGESGSGSSMLHLMVQGEARSAGRIGDRIQVRNKQSGVMLQAEVIDEGVVRIKF